MSNQTLPVAILGGCALIGLGLYFGLRARTPEIVTSVPPESARPASIVASTTPPAVAPSAPNASDTQAAVKAELDKRKQTLVASCWKPLAAKAPKPASAKLSWTGTVGANGKPVAYGISEHREAYRAGLSECVQKELVSLQVAPPGRSVELSVDFELP